MLQIGSSTSRIRSEDVAFLRRQFSTALCINDEHGHGQPEPLVNDDGRLAPCVEAWIDHLAGVPHIVVRTDHGVIQLGYFGAGDQGISP